MAKACGPNYSDYVRCVLAAVSVWSLARVSRAAKWIAARMERKALALAEKHGLLGER